MFFYVCSFFKSLLAVNLFARSPALSPTLYKFIVLGSYPKSFGLGLQIVTLQLASSVGRACARVSVTVDDGKTRSTTSEIEGITIWGSFLKPGSEGSVHTMHTDQSQPQGGSHISHAENNKNLRQEIDQLKRELCHAKRKRTSSNSDNYSGDEQDINYR